MRKFLLITLSMLLVLLVGLKAQVTTSSLSGTVKGEKGEALPGASVKAIHQPTGTRYGVTSNADGRFSLSNMRVGGPYQIEVSYIGFQAETYNNIVLKLGETFVLSPVLRDVSRALQQVVIVGERNTILNSKRTGAATNISTEQIENLPTISRSLQDFTRLTPQANGNSFGGANGRFNNITIDGAVNNDVFGASSTAITPGASTGTQPISLDAIQEIQVVLAPYDVSIGNFTGAGVNAITRSGTNEFEGSVYFFGRNENTQGKNVLTNAKIAPYTDNQYGVRIGGPIIPNKLFFFANVEMGKRLAPIANNAGDNGAAISAVIADSIARYTLRTYSYDVGNFQAVDLARENKKLFTKLDWNINSKNQLTARYNFIDAFDDNLTRTATFFNFGNNGYQFKSKQNIGILELRSSISNKLTNNLILGYTRIRDARSTIGTLFPSVTINEIDGKPGNSAEFGSQRSSVGNELDQDIFEITDNFKYTLGKHNLTFGTHNEFFKFRNLFVNDLNGRWTFTNLADYVNNKPASVAATVSNIPGNPKPAAEFKAAQLAFYAQDEFEAARGLRLTVGLRMDVPVYSNEPLRNPLVESSFPGYNTDRTPGKQPLFAPRLGFNYDIKGDRSIQLRGGTGIFTGRVPFVWISNQYGGSGPLFNNVNVTGPGAASGTIDPNLVFIKDPNNQASAGSAVTPRSAISLVSTDFKISQVFRSNIAGDFKLPFGIVGTLEGIFSKTLNNVTYKDLNLASSTARLNPALTNGADLRKVYTNRRVDNPNYTNVLLLENTNKGYTYNFTAQLQKSFKNLYAMIAYTNTEAKSVNDGASSTAQSNWEFVQIVDDPNNPNLATSNYQTRHRIVSSVNYHIDYGKNKTFGTGIALFYVGYSGQPFSYIYTGNLNEDNNNTGAGNDLFYVPRNSSEIKFLPLAPTATAPALSPAQQWEALNAFIDGDKYLQSRRGQYTERNGARVPFQHQFDLRISQDFGAIVKGTKNKIQLTFDIINFGNLLNKEWGRQYSISNQSFGLVSVANPNAATGGFTFRAPANNKAYTASPFGSAWLGQFGVRYLFN